MRDRVRVPSVLVAALLLGSAVPARAQDDPAEAQAQAGQSFELGMRLLEEENWSGALAAFERAYQLAPHYAVLFNIGFCQKKLQRYPEALESFQRYLAEGGDQVRPEKRAEAEQAIADLRLLLAEVRVAVDVDGAEILVDDRARGTSPLAEPLVLGAGHHVIVARLPDRRDARSEFDLAPGEARTIELSFGAATGAGAGSAPGTPPDEDGGAWYEDWLGWTLGGVGLAAAGAGLGLLGAGLATEGDADGEPNIQTQRTMYQDAAQEELIGAVLGGVGGALLVTGIVLLAITEAAGESPPAEADAGIGWLPLVAPGSLGLRLVF